MLDLENIQTLKKQELIDALNDLILNDFNTLVRLLYRIDINEKKLKQTLQQNTGTNAGEIIATLVLQRLAEKENTRSQFKQNNSIPEDERW